MEILLGERQSFRLLVVDDNETILFALREYFGRAGFRVTCASTLEAATACLAAARYDALIVDFRLSGTDSSEGLDVIDAARASSPAAKIVLLTAYLSPEVEREARARGALAFFHKPSPLVSVLATLERLLTRRAPEDSPGRLSDAPRARRSP